MDKIYTEEQLHECLENILNAFDYFSRNAINIKFNVPEILVNVHKYNVSNNWLKLYEVDVAQLVYETIQVAFNAIGAVLKPDSEKIELRNPLILSTLFSLMEADKENDKIFELYADRFVPVFVSARCIVVIVVCQLQYKESIQSLISNARSGDLDSIFKLVKLDHTFLNSDFTSKIICDSELKNDSWIMESLAKALKPDRNFWLLKRKRNYIACLFLHYLYDYGYRTNKQWSEFLARHIRNYADPENVRRARERFGLNKPPKK